MAGRDLIFAVLLCGSALGGQRIAGAAGSLSAILGEGSRVGIEPAAAPRRTSATFDIIIELGKGGLPRTDSLGIVNGTYLDRWKFAFPSHHWGGQPPWQIDDPTAPAYTTASCSRPGVSVSLKVGRSGGRKPYVNQPSHFVRSLRERLRHVLEVAADGDLAEGDTIRIRWGDRSGGSPGVVSPVFATRYYFMPFRYSLLPARDRDLPIRRGEFALLPAIRVEGRDAVRLHVFCRPLQGVNEAFDLGIAAVDECGNPAEDFEGDVLLSCRGEGVMFPKRVRFGRTDRGTKRVTGLRASAAGWYRIDAACGRIAGRSNYLVVSGGAPGERLYFGDMHSHTIDCDGTIDTRGHFEYGPSVAGLDFGAVSCHAEYFGCAEAWRRYLDATSKANRPGEFVTFYGYEWAQEGHFNAYFLDPDQAVLIYGKRIDLVKGIARPPDRPAFRTPATREGEVMRMLRRLTQPVFAIAHVHTRYSKQVDDGVLWLDEVYSAHRHARSKREARLRGNLARGLRLGVVAGSDMHRLTIGHLCKQPGKRWPQGGWESCQYQTGGLQGTFSRELTRKALYEGMKARRTYGTSGARIVLLYSCGGRPQGSEVILRGGQSPEFTIEVGGTAALTGVVLCRYDGTAWTELPQAVPRGTDRWSGTCRDTAFGRSGIYYVRITQADGENAWSSPIWVKDSR
ncbi:MAG: DUF3604 domain-containing protein [Planctomycetota bacterium]|jgi:hypothetical protein